MPSVQTSPPNTPHFHKGQTDSLRYLIEDKGGFQTLDVRTNSPETVVVVASDKWAQVALYVMSTPWDIKTYQRLGGESGVTRSWSVTLESVDAGKATLIVTRRTADLKA